MAGGSCHLSRVWPLPGCGLIMPDRRQLARSGHTTGVRRSAILPTGAERPRFRGMPGASTQLRTTRLSILPQRMHFRCVWAGYDSLYGLHIAHRCANQHCQWLIAPPHRCRFVRGVLNATCGFNTHDANPMIEREFHDTTLSNQFASIAKDDPPVVRQDAGRLW